MWAVCAWALSSTQLTGQHTICNPRRSCCQCLTVEAVGTRSSPRVHMRGFSNVVACGCGVGRFADWHVLIVGYVVAILHVVCCVSMAVLCVAKAWRTSRGLHSCTEDAAGTSKSAAAAAGAHGGRRYIGGAAKSPVHANPLLAPHVRDAKAAAGDGGSSGDDCDVDVNGSSKAAAQRFGSPASPARFAMRGAGASRSGGLTSRDALRSTVPDIVVDSSDGGASDGDSQRDPASPSLRPAALPGTMDGVSDDGAAVTTSNVLTNPSLAVYFPKKTAKPGRFSMAGSARASKLSFNRLAVGSSGRQMAAVTGSSTPTASSSPGDASGSGRFVTSDGNNEY